MTVKRHSRTLRLFYALICLELCLAVTLTTCLTRATIFDSRVQYVPPRSQLSDAELNGDGFRYFKVNGTGLKLDTKVLTSYKELVAHKGYSYDDLREHHFCTAPESDEDYKLCAAVGGVATAGLLTLIDIIVGNSLLALAILIQIFMRDTLRHHRHFRGWSLASWLNLSGCFLLLIAGFPLYMMHNLSVSHLVMRLLEGSTEFTKIGTVTVRRHSTVFIAVPIMGLLMFFLSEMKLVVEKCQRISVQHKSEATTSPSGPLEETKILISNPEDSQTPPV
eukprot:Protomagalhaensia_wolfi_Nauph_80__5632@NODE_649_length_2161_cov_161_729972_g485_i0_p2_GENE_NODE_649_length_2161_cov_161_729972_g485_i0NODE_649_length_2161_cov_161_729972_g485_i0_p2_ORF_typecomplete_len278_score23_02_NODE_649_length_2161_cov_161_729972_g485_i0144977